MDRSKFLVAGSFALLALAGIGLYTPFRSRMLYHADSVGLAFSIHNFDVVAHHPQAPGFPLYVLLLRAVEFVSGASDNDTIVMVSIAAAIGSALLFCGLACNWLSRTDAFALSLVLLTSPLVWFNAEIAMRYSVALFGSLAVALSCFAIIRGSVRARYTTPVILGIAAGFCSEGALLLPLTLYCLWPFLRSSRRFLATACTLAAFTVVLWLVPLVHYSGRLRRYLGAMHAKASADAPLGFIMRGDLSFALNLMLKNILVASAFLLVALLGVVPVQVMRARNGAETLGRTPQMTFLLLWAIPGLLLLSIATVGHSGHILPYLPALLLLLVPKSSEKSNGKLSPPPPLSHRSQWLFAGVSLQVALFLFVPQQLTAPSGNWAGDTLFRSVFLEPTRSRIQQYDTMIEHLVTDISARFRDGETLLIVPIGDERPRSMPIRTLYAQGTYYLPQFEQRGLYLTQLPLFRKLSWSGYVTADISVRKFDLLRTNIVAIPPSVRWLVWFCDVKDLPYSFDDSWHRYSSPSGTELVVTDLKSSPGTTRRWGPFEFQQQTTKAREH